MKDRNLEHKDDWKTPAKIYEQLNNEFNFDFDPCPYKHDVTQWDGLQVDWGDSNFVNPPYSRKLKEAFVEKAVIEKIERKDICPSSTCKHLYCFIS